MASPDSYCTILNHNGGRQLEIAVIESTIMIHEFHRKKRKQIPKVFNIIIEDKNSSISLVRFIEDFTEFHERIKHHYRKCKISLPQLNEPQLSDFCSGKRKSLRSFFSSLTRLPSAKTNSQKIEDFLMRCALDKTVGRSSLFRDFISAQRDEDQIVPRVPLHAFVQCHSGAERSGSQTWDHGNNNQSPSHSSESSVHNGDTGRQLVTIQDFRLLRVLGKGSMGKVLLVRRRGTSNLLALKVINKAQVIVQREVEHTKAERDILTAIARIRHPFLIRLHHAFQDANQLFLVMDLHIGGDMATQLARFTCFSPDRARLYTAEILLGIQELHNLGIIYRDLKPENILLDVGGHIVLTDFGLSKQFTDKDGSEHRTSTFCGTPEYLAPEILQMRPHSYAVDFWSLGTLLYEMLTGQTPFCAADRSYMYYRMLNDDLVFTKHIEPVTADFISGLLQRDPEKRLGAGINGREKIRSHLYFSSLDWPNVYNRRITPAYIPPLESPTDLRNFDRDFLTMPTKLSAYYDPLTDYCETDERLEEAFKGYSYYTNEIPSSIHDSSIRVNESDFYYDDNLYSMSNRDDNDVVPYDFYTESDFHPSDESLETIGTITEDTTDVDSALSLSDHMMSPVPRLLTHHYGSRQIPPRAF